MIPRSETRPVKDAKCAGCGHRLDRHRPYTNGGHNRHGCTLVCTVDNCQLWRECRLADIEARLHAGFDPREER